MDRKIYVGNTNDLAKSPDKIYIGDSNDVARLAKKIYVGDSNNKARQVWPAFKWTEVYQRCEYILNTGRSEYINTGVKPNNYTRFIIDFKLESHASGTGDNTVADVGQGIYNYVGITANSTSDRYWIKLYFNTRKSSTSPFNYDAPVAKKTYSSASQVMERHVIDFNRNGGYFYIDDEQVGYNVSTFSTYEMFLPLFASATSSYDQVSTDNTYKYRLYSFKAYNNTTLIRDMVPCYRKSDIEIGMYDFVNEIFYTNAGSGIFYKGPDVN